MALTKADPPVEAVFSSPYYRCLQTVTPFVELNTKKAAGEAGAIAAIGGAAVVGARSTAGNAARDGAGAGAGGAIKPPTKIRPEHGLSEWYGSADFEHPRPAPAATLKRMFPAYDASYASVAQPSATGETIAQLHDRVAAATEGLIARCDAEGVRAALLCTHAAVVIALGRVLTGNMPASVEEEDFRAFTCGLSVYRRREPQRASSSFRNAADSAGQHPSGDDESSTRLEPGSETRNADLGSLGWRNGRGVGGGWICEVDSDCSFLSGGEERGW